MARPTLKRTFGFAALGSSLLLAGLLSACGDDEPSAEAIVIQPSSYSTIVSTTAPPAAAASGETPAGGTVAGTQVYVVQSGDFLAGIAADYGIPPESIARFNDWEDGINHPIHPDQSINIPPGAQVPDADDDDEDSDSDSDSNSDEDEDTQDEETQDEETEETQDLDNPRCPDGTRQGTYTIEAGDIPANVANSLDVTVDQLNEANANTPGYRAFIVGATILVPCGDDD
jgi:LysM repeat protein